jgi:hypothetical protein
MRIPTSALVAASLFAASLAPAGASAIRVPAAGSIVIHSHTSNLFGQHAPASAPKNVAGPNQAKQPSQREIQKQIVKLRNEFHGKPAGTVTGYLADAEYGVFELSGKKIVGYYSDCAEAEGAKVDASGNLWVACTESSSVNEYAPGATAATLTLNALPSGWYYNFVADVAFDSAGDIWADSLYGYNGSFEFEYGSTAYWPANTVANGAAPSGTIVDPNLAYDYFIDVDPTGTYLYIDGLNASFTGYEADVYTGGTATEFFVPTFPGGIYVDGNGNVNVNDQEAYTVTQFTGGASPTATGVVYGPWPSNFFGGFGDPVAIGFNQGDTEIAAGDAGFRSYDTLTGLTKFNKKTGGYGKSHAYPSINFGEPIGAAFSPSDKGGN